MTKIKDKIKDCFQQANLIAAGLNNKNIDQNIVAKLLRLIRELYCLLPASMEETKNALKTWDKNFSQLNYIQLPYCLGHILL